MCAASDARYITPEDRAQIRATLSGGWDGPLDMERDLLDHADAMDAKFEALRADYDSLADVANALGREKAEVLPEILRRLRANANATGLPACHDCVIEIANWLDPRDTHA